MSESTDVSTVDRSPETWWDEEADEVQGYDLVRDEALMQLAGVPFKITNVTFREGIQREGSPYRDDYVSVELTVAPPIVFRASHARIESRRKSMKVPEGTPVAQPEEQLVINDGSTGIYRQVVQYLAAKEMIRLPEGETEGSRTIYDLPRSEWLAGADGATVGIDVGLKCSRGLRFSDYQNPSNPREMARTWYIA